MGMTRSDKSATFNWIRGLKMKREENRYETHVNFEVMDKAIMDPLADHHNAAR